MAKLNYELLTCARSFVNTLKDRELDLRGDFFHVSLLFYYVKSDIDARE